MLRVERGEVKALILFILSCYKRVWIKHRHAKRVGAFCWNKWAGGGGGENGWLFLCRFFSCCAKKGYGIFSLYRGKLYMCTCLSIHGVLIDDVLIGILFLWMEVHVGQNCCKVWVRE